MQTATLLALLVFLLTYALISVRRVRSVSIDRPAAALFGAVLMIVLGLLPVDQVFSAINLDIIGLLLGMMIIVSCLEITGLFDRVSYLLVEKCGDLFTFLWVSMGVTALLSALILNDTVVLMFTPIIIKVCRSMDANPVPFLVGEALAANIGSVATGVGNPQNAYIVIQSGISFPDFALVLTPLALASLLVAVVIVALVFKKDLFDGNLGNPKVIDRKLVMNGMHRTKMEAPFFLVIAVLLTVFIGFIASPWLDAPISLIAFLGGCFLLLVLPLIKRDTGTQPILRGVDWTLLLFFVGLFIVLKGVETSGLMELMLNSFEGLGAGVAGVAGLSTISAVLSNLISNVPAVMLLAPAIPAGSNTLWLALASSSTLAGNATILGAAANIIVVEKGLGMGVEVRLRDFVKAGLPVTLVTLLMSVLYLGI
ncbi:MAG: SLC13 family permease [Methanomassiliicoccales archaeon]|nr:SLC13 family permease [Methanomassiliicoccales archaeon]